MQILYNDDEISALWFPQWWLTSVAEVWKILPLPQEIAPLNVLFPERIIQLHVYLNYIIIVTIT